MAKVKRSDVANRTAKQTPSPTEPEGLIPSPTETGYAPYSTEPGNDETQTGDEEAPVQDDPRDAAIRHLQIGLTLMSLVVVGLIVAVILLLSRGAPGVPVSSSSPSSSSSTSAPATQAPYFSTNYVAVNPDVKQGAIVLEIHDDYQCPWCERAEQIYGDALNSLSQSGDIDLRIHIRTLVGDQIIHNDSSERAGIAALCANTVGHFWDYHTTIFANQPEEGVGYTDDQLRTDFASQAGITGTDLTNFQTCYDTKATSSQLTAMEQEGTAAGINGTPSFFVNGQKVSFDLQANSATVQPADAANLLAELQQNFG